VWGHGASRWGHGGVTRHDFLIANIPRLAYSLCVYNVVERAHSRVVLDWLLSKTVGSV